MEDQPAEKHRASADIHDGKRTEGLDVVRTARASDPDADAQAALAAPSRLRPLRQRLPSWRRATGSISDVSPGPSGTRAAHFSDRGRIGSTRASFPRTPPPQVLAPRTRPLNQPANRAPRGG